MDPFWHHQKEMTARVQPDSSVPQWTVRQSKYGALCHLNPVRCIVAGPSAAGKGVWLQAMLTDMMRGCYDRIFLFSPSADIDNGWDPVKKYVRDKLGVDERKEPWFFSDWDEKRLWAIIDEQKQVVREQKKGGAGGSSASRWPSTTGRTGRT